MNKTLKKFSKLALLADLARESAEDLHEDWLGEFGRSDAMINLAETERSGKSLNDAVAYRDFLWQVKVLMNQLEALNSDAILSNKENFESL